MIDENTRARQHLLVQGFVLMPAAAACCTRAMGPGTRAILDDPELAWAVEFDHVSGAALELLAPDDPLLPIFTRAAQAAARGTRQIVASLGGGHLLVPLNVTDARDARARIESANVTGYEPSPERVQALPDELLERELRRRGRLPPAAEEEPPEDPGSNPGNGNPGGGPPVDPPADPPVDVPVPPRARGRANDRTTSDEAN